MEERHFNELKNNLADCIKDSFAEQDEKSAEAKMRARMDRLIEENKLMTLPPDEVALLLDYRTWKTTANAATGVFHWKRHVNV